MYALMCVSLSNYLTPHRYISMWAFFRGLNDTSMCVVVEMSICYQRSSFEDRIRVYSLVVLHEHKSGPRGGLKCHFH